MRKLVEIDINLPDEYDPYILNFGGIDETAWCDNEEPKSE